MENERREQGNGEEVQRCRRETTEREGGEGEEGGGKDEDEREKRQEEVEETRGRQILKMENSKRWEVREEEGIRR